MQNEVVAIIGTRGFGLPCARRLGIGRRLLIGDVSQEILDTAAASLTAQGYDVSSCLIDVSKRDSIRAFAAKAAELGPLKTWVLTGGLVAAHGLAGTHSRREYARSHRSAGSLRAVGGQGHGRRHHREQCGVYGTDPC